MAVAPPFHTERLYLFDDASVVLWLAVLLFMQARRDADTQLRGDWLDPSQPK